MPLHVQDSCLAGQVTHLAVNGRPDLVQVSLENDTLVPNNTRLGKAISTAFQSLSVYFFLASTVLHIINFFLAIYSIVHYIGCFFGNYLSTQVRIPAGSC
jgi:hypothetical protein